MADQWDLMAQAESKPYEAAIEAARRNYARQREILQNDLARSQQENYVSRRLAERDIPQRLSAYGMHGGLTETSEMDLRNRYNRQRGLLDEGYQFNLGNLSIDESNELGKLQAQIAAAYARAASQRAQEQARAAEAARQAALSSSSQPKTTSGTSSANTMYALMPASLKENLLNPNYLLNGSSQPDPYLMKGAVR